MLAICCTYTSKCTATLLYRGTQTLAQGTCVSQGLIREDSLPQTADDTPANAAKNGCCWQSLLQRHITRSCSAQCPPGHPDLFLQVCFPTSQPQICSVLWSYLSPGAGYSVTKTLHIFVEWCEVPAYFSNVLSFIWMAAHPPDAILPRFFIIIRLAEGAFWPIIQVITKRLDSSRCHVNA